MSSVRKLNSQLEVKLRSKNEELFRYKDEVSYNDYKILKERAKNLESDNVELTKHLKLLIEQNGENEMMIS